MNKQNPKISIIIPIYNTEEYLRECLNSVINQTLKEIEIILIDDGSTDNSGKICEEYASKDKRIKVIHQKNQGAAISRNKGIDLAQGKYLYFLDSDDYIESDTLEKMLNKIEQEDADICICRNYEIDGNIKILSNSLVIELLPQKSCFNMNDIPKSIFNFCHPTVWHKLYKKNFINKYEIKYQNLSSCNDVFFNAISLVLAERITCLNEALVFHRINTNNSITAKRYIFSDNIFKAAKKTKYYLKKINKFEAVKHSFYIAFINYFVYEQKWLKSKKTKFLFYFKTFCFLPKNYFSLFYSKASKEKCNE